MKVLLDLRILRKMVHLSQKQPKTHFALNQKQAVFPPETKGLMTCCLEVRKARKRKMNNQTRIF